MKLLNSSLSFSILLAVALILPSSALAASLSLSPSSGTLNKGCPVTLDINLDTGGSDTDGTDAILFYDNTRFSATSIDTELPIKIYSDYPGSNIDEASGKITVSGLASVSSGFNGKGTLAKINLTVKEAAPTGATQIKFDYTSGGKTTDSNVVQRGTVADILTSVTNGNYTIGTGNCAAPSPSPVVIRTGGQGQATGFTTSTPAAQVQVKTLDQAVGGTTGATELTFTLAIVGSALTILGILGLALL